METDSPDRRTYARPAHRRSWGRGRSDTRPADDGFSVGAQGRQQVADCCERAAGARRRAL